MKRKAKSSKDVAVQCMLTVYSGLHEWVNIACFTVQQFCCNVKQFALKSIICLKEAVVLTLISVQSRTWNFIKACKSAVVEWVKKLVNSITSFFAKIWHSFVHILLRIKNDITGAVMKVKNWIAQKLAAVSRCIHTSVLYAKGFFSAKLLAACAAFKRLHLNVTTWTHQRVMQPMKRMSETVLSFLRYWFGAQWWPGLKIWLIARIKRRLQRTFNYVCFGLVYLFCCYWVEPVSAYLIKRLKQLFAWIQRTTLAPLWRLVNIAIKQTKMHFLLEMCRGKSGVKRKSYGFIKVALICTLRDK